MLWHQSGVNLQGEPFVQLLLDDKLIGQFSPEECRDHARAITEAAEAAEQDAFLFDFVKTKLDGSEEQAMAMLIEFRRYREARGKKGPPSDRAEFIVPEHKKPRGSL